MFSGVTNKMRTVSSVFDDDTDFNTIHRRFISAEHDTARAPVKIQSEQSDIQSKKPEPEARARS